MIVDVRPLTPLSSLVILHGRGTVVVGLWMALWLRRLWRAKRIDLSEGTINRVSNRLIVLVLCVISMSIIRSINISGDSINGSLDFFISSGS